VLAGSRPEAEAVAVRLSAGAVSINDGALTSMIWEAEKSSWGASGLGPSRMGGERLPALLPPAGADPAGGHRFAPRRLCRGDAAVRTFAEAMPNIHAHEGEWEGSYRHVALDGTPLDEHRTWTWCEFPADGPYAYVQHNRLSWTDGREAAYDFGGVFRDVCCTGIPTGSTAMAGRRAKGC
jgi:hypothetical protein